MISHLFFSKKIGVAISTRFKFGKRSSWSSQHFFSLLKNADVFWGYLTLQSFGDCIPPVLWKWVVKWMVNKHIPRRKSLSCERTFKAEFSAVELRNRLKELCRQVAEDAWRTVLSIPGPFTISGAKWGTILEGIFNYPSRRVELAPLGRCWIQSFNLLLVIQNMLNMTYVLGSTWRHIV